MLEKSEREDKDGVGRQTVRATHGSYHVSGEMGRSAGSTLQEGSIRTSGEDFMNDEHFNFGNEQTNYFESQAGLVRRSERLSCAVMLSFPEPSMEEATSENGVIATGQNTPDR